MSHFPWWGWWRKPDPLITELRETYRILVERVESLEAVVKRGPSNYRVGQIERQIRDTRVAVADRLTAIDGKGSTL